MAKGFAATIGAWGSSTLNRTSAIHKRSIEILAETMVNTKGNGGRLPFLTGNLARSILASTSGMPKTAAGPFSGGNVGAVVATLKLDQAIWIGFQAAYARRQNSGFVGSDSLGRKYNVSGSYFVEGAIADWPQIARRAAAEVQSSTK